MNTRKWMTLVLIVIAVVGLLCGFLLGYMIAPRNKIIEVGIVNEIESIKEVEEWGVRKNTLFKEYYAMDIEFEINGIQQEVKFRRTDYRDFYYDLVKFRELINKQLN